MRRLKALRPFTSRDLDLYTDSQEAVAKAADALHCERFLGDAGSPDIVLGGLWLPEVEGQSPLVQFLNGPIGIKNSAEIFQTQENYSWPKEDLVLPVMHPVLTLESKLKCIYELPQKKRNDLRHLKMALEYVPCYIADAVFEGDDKSALKMIKRIKRLCLSPEAVRCFFDHNIEIERSIPIEEISKSVIRKLQSFFQTEWPLMKTQISRRREKEQIKRDRIKNSKAVVRPT